MSKSRYLIISPVKDEAAFIRRTLESVVAQSVKPCLWLIVDDGSTDGTQDIIRSYAETHDFIRLIEGGDRGHRAPGSRVVRAFNRGYESLGVVDYQFIVKLDCDLSFEHDYFEKLLSTFETDPELGIASGIYSEPCDEARWRKIKFPNYHAAGASKMMRRACFEEIGGFVPARGWDTVDEIRAMARGWRTAHFPDLEMKHWKIEGSGIGPLRTNYMHGEVYYLTGGGPLFFLFKALHRAVQRPYIIGAIGLVFGYVETMARGKHRIVTKEEARCYRTLLNSRITRRLRLPWTAPAG